jgi:hypothetical protein
LCPKYIQLVNDACETEEGFNILNAIVVDLKKKLYDAKNCKGNAKEDNIRLSANIVDKEDQSCVISIKCCTFKPLNLYMLIP